MKRILEYFRKLFKKKYINNYGDAIFNCLLEMNKKENKYV